MLPPMGVSRSQPTPPKLPFRLGGLSYLNTRPLVYGIEQQIVPGEPAEMADGMRQGQFDAAIVPVAEVLRQDRYDVLDGVAIASHGPVFSVILVHQVPLEKLTRVGVVTASRTSAWLVRVILKCGYDVEPEFYSCAPGVAVDDQEAMVLIGDPAIRYRLGQDSPPVLDLGEAWTGLTGLPFVYAVWALRRPVAPGSALPARLRQAKADGLAHLEQIVQDATEFTAEFRREYLTRYVGFDLGASEKKAIGRFQQYLQELGLIERGYDLRYVT